MIFASSTHNLLAVITLAIILFAAKCDTLQPQTKSAIFALSLEDLSRKAELIIEGEVLGKGTHAGNTIKCPDTSIRVYI